MIREDLPHQEVRADAKADVGIPNAALDIGFFERAKRIIRAGYLKRRTQLERDILAAPSRQLETLTAFLKDLDIRHKRVEGREAALQAMTDDKKRAYTKINNFEYGILESEQSEIRKNRDVALRKLDAIGKRMALSGLPLIEEETTAPPHRPYSSREMGADGFPVMFDLRDTIPNMVVMELAKDRDIEDDGDLPILTDIVLPTPRVEAAPEKAALPEDEEDLPVLDASQIVTPGHLYDPSHIEHIEAFVPRALLDFPLDPPDMREKQAPQLKALNVQRPLAEKAQSSVAVGQSAPEAAETPEHPLPKKEYSAKDLLATMDPGMARRNPVETGTEESVGKIFFDGGHHVEEDDGDEDAFVPLRADDPKRWAPSYLLAEAKSMEDLLVMAGGANLAAFHYNGTEVLYQETLRELQRRKEENPDLSPDELRQKNRHVLFHAEQLRRLIKLSDHLKKIDQADLEQMEMEKAKAAKPQKASWLSRMGKSLSETFSNAAAAVRETVMDTQYAFAKLAVAFAAPQLLMMGASTLAHKTEITESGPKSVVAQSQTGQVAKPVSPPKSEQRQLALTESAPATPAAITDKTPMASAIDDSLAHNDKPAREESLAQPPAHKSPAAPAMGTPHRHHTHGKIRYHVQFPARADADVATPPDDLRAPGQDATPSAALYSAFTPAAEAPTPERQTPSPDPEELDPEGRPPEARLPAGADPEGYPDDMDQDGMRWSANRFLGQQPK